MIAGIDLQYEGAMAKIVIDLPPLNVLTNDALTALNGSFVTAAAHKEVRLIRLEARGKFFSAGVDVSDHIGDKVQTMMHRLLELFETLDRIEQPTIGVVHGTALGGGCELIAALDLCYAADSARFGQPEINLGLFAPPASVLLPRLIGERRALEMLLTGAPISASVAAEWGLINAAHPADELVAKVDVVCEQLLKMSGVALRQAKRAVQISRDDSIADAHRTVYEQYLTELMKSEDAHEGLAAFLEKRPPNWRHR
jgi:cyclohexa-1,5-dienecarbonyl-CoA hydratase